MRDWLERPGEPASDLDLVVLLLNSLDLLDDPPDRLTDLTWLSEVLAAVGRDDIADALSAGDLAGLRQLRDSLRAVFAAGTLAEAVSLLNSMLVRASAVPQLVAASDGLRLQVAPGRGGSRRCRHGFRLSWPSTSHTGASAGSAPAPHCPANACSWTAPGRRRAGSAAVPATTGRPPRSIAAGGGPPPASTPPPAEAHRRRAEAAKPRPCSADGGHRDGAAHLPGNLSVYLLVSSLMTYTTHASFVSTKGLYPTDGSWDAWCAR